MVNLKDKKILVIGATGFVGGRLVERLILEEHASVRAFVRNWSKAVWVSRVAADLIYGDLLDYESVLKAVADCEIVFHCASGLGPDGTYTETNIKGTKNILDACVEAGVSRLVYLSSIAVHGSNPPDGADESVQFQLSGRDYSDSKIKAEQLLMEYWGRFKLPITILRPTFVWGPRSHLFTMRQLREMHNGTFSLVDGGDGSCHAIYIDNLIDAMLLASIRDEAVGESFIITDGTERTWGEFFQYYADLLDIKELKSISSSNFLSKFCCHSVDELRSLLNKLAGNPAPLWRKVIRRSAKILLTQLERKGYPSYWDIEKYARKGDISIDKARKVLGYEPRYDLESGMTETLAWVKDQMGYELDIQSPEA